MARAVLLNGGESRRFQGNSFLALQSPQASPCMSKAASPAFSPAQGYAVAPMHSFELPQSPLSATPSSGLGTVLGAPIPPFPGTVRPGTSILELIGPCRSPSQGFAAAASPSLMERTRANTCDISRTALAPEQIPTDDYRTRQRAATASFASRAEQQAAVVPTHVQQQGYPQKVPSIRPTPPQLAMSVVDAAHLSMAPSPLASPSSVPAAAPSTLHSSQAFTKQGSPSISTQQSTMSPSQGFTRQVTPTCSLQGFSRQVTPSSPISLPSSPAWTTVTSQRKQPTVPKMEALPPSLPEAVLPSHQEPLQRLSTADDSCDMYYDQKELFVRGWTRAAKGSRSIKMNRKIDYQVDKRRQQSERDKAAMMPAVDDDEFSD